MSEKDFAVNAVGQIGSAGAIQASNISGVPISRKPSYLISVETKEKNKSRFITIDKPEYLDGFVQVKGIYSEASEDEIINNFVSILTSTKKELYCEILFPRHKINNIRNLVYKRN